MASKILDPMLSQESPIPVTDWLPAVGLAGRMLEKAKELDEKEPKGNRKIKTRVSRHNAYTYNVE